MFSLRRIIALFGMLAGLMLVTSGPVMAMGMGDKITLTPEKQTIYDAIMKEHSGKIETIKINLWGKETEINAFQGNPRVEPETISKLVNEAIDLKLQLKTAENELSEALKKELGIIVTKGSMCPMMGDGMMGKGMMMGKDMMGKGMMHNGGDHGGAKHKAGTGSAPKSEADTNGEKPAEHSTHSPEKKQ